MKIAISAQGKELDSMVDPRFGRAMYFIIYDTDSKTHEVIDNEQNALSAQGAGVQASQKVVAHKPDMVVSGNFGPKAFQIISAAGIKITLCKECKVSEAIEIALSDQLKVADKPNVTGHWK